MSFRVQVDDRELEVEIVARRPHLRVRIGGREHVLEEASVAQMQFALRLDGRMHGGYRCRDGEQLEVRFGGHTYRVRLHIGAKDDSEVARVDEVRASMPGVVVAVHCAAGDRVAAGDALLTIESMKLQAIITAAHAARIAALHVAPQSVFERHALLISFAAAEST
jgi:acetyl/propionyl-CoA carboxylase alpha subunit